jgi:hypothetical protein
LIERWIHMRERGPTGADRMRPMRIPCTIRLASMKKHPEQFAALPVAVPSTSMLHSGPGRMNALCLPGPFVNTHKCQHGVIHGIRG